MPAGGFEVYSQKLKYNHINPDSPLMRPVSNAIMNMQLAEPTDEDIEIVSNARVIIPPWELEKSTCKSKPIICYIRNKDGDYTISGNNGTNRVLPYCIRHVLQNDTANNYLDCKVICCQPAHAEVMAVINYLLYTNMVDFQDIFNFFPNTKAENGKVIFGRVDHVALGEFVKNIRLGEDVEVSLYGHEICCDECAKILLNLGITEINVAPETHKDEYARRNRIHENVTPEEFIALGEISINTVVVEG